MSWGFALEGSTFRWYNHVQCWSVSEAHAGLLGEDCPVESQHMYIKELDQIILIFSSKISLHSRQL